jgi:ABC-2 type transport system ATP-binding protein
LEHVLKVNGISKQYGAIKALNNVSLSVPEGSIYGILGPNGSGKTTLLATILNVLLPDTGRYSWLEAMPEHEARKHLGCLLETPNFYHYLSAWDNLEIAALIKGKGLQDRERVLKALGLFDRRYSKFQTFSLGMKQRLALASSLLGQPKVLVLDEPTNGLDPGGIAEIREMILKLNREGITIIMASHLLDEVEKVCTHVAILKKGNLLVEGPVDEALTNEDYIEISATDLTALYSAISQMPGIKSVRYGNKMLLVTIGKETTARDMNNWCFTNGHVLTHLVMKKKSLESKFIELTNQA